MCFLIHFKAPTGVLKTTFYLDFQVIYAILIASLARLWGRNESANASANRVSLRVFPRLFTCLEEKNTQGPQQGLNSDLVALLEK